MILDLSAEFRLYENREFLERKQGSEHRGTGNVIYFILSFRAAFFGRRHSNERLVLLIMRK
jgi:hypothetical protein